MKKKFLIVVALIVVLLIGLFILTGCGNKKESSNNISDNESNLNKKEESSSSSKDIVIEGVKYKFDKEDHFSNGFNYKYSSSFEIDVLGTTRFYSLLNSDKNKSVEIRVTTSSITPEQILSEKESNYSNDNTTNVKSENKTIDDIQWFYIEYNNTQKEKNYTNHEYYYKYNDEYCVIKFKIDSSINDISELEQEFINNVSFK